MKNEEMGPMDSIKINLRVIPRCLKQKNKISCIKWILSHLFRNFKELWKK